MFAGCIVETSKDNLKALLGLVVLAQIVSISLDGKCQKRALLVAAKEFRLFKKTKQSFYVTVCIFYTFTGSSKKFEERQSVDDNLTI